MRYIRQEIFAEIGKKGQEKLGKSNVAIVGLGALGSVSAELLARAGIGKLILIDRDVVEVSNLQRQSLFDENDVGKPKALAAKGHLTKINSDIEIDFFIDDLNFENINKIVQITNPNNGKNNKKIKNKLNLIIDCTDNLETRFLINDFSIKNRIPFIYSSAVGSKGYVFNAIPGEAPCLRCFLKEAAQLDTCETVGVLNTITTLISSIQANEAIKILLNKNNIEKNLLFFDVWKNELLKIKISKNKNCICCVKHNFEYLNGKKSSRIVKLCGDNIYQIKSKSTDKKQFDKLKNKLKKIGKVVDFGYCINFDNTRENHRFSVPRKSGRFSPGMTIFNDGRALIKANGKKEAKSLYSKFVGN